MFHRILLAIDATNSADVAISYASSLAVGTDASIRVVHVNEYLVGGRGFTVATQAEAISRLEAAVFLLRGAGIKTEGSLYQTSCFDVEGRIANAAQDWQADVIVLGSRRHRRFGRFGGKGMRDRITALTALPILVAPAPLAVSDGPMPTLPALETVPLVDFPSISI